MTTSNKTLVQVYNKVVQKEYYKIIPRLLWNHYELVHAKQLEDTVHVTVDTNKPIKVKVNGEEYIKK